MALTPCAVIVDTRNVHGHGKKLLGVERRPSASGIRDALQPYGFDAVDIYAGVATKGTKDHSAQSAQVQQALKHNRDYATRLRGEGVTVLEGRIAERNKMEEKQVDVLLALQVADLVDQMSQLAAPFQHIVVLSEDMDLIPAYEYAARRGVEVYAAAADTIHVRPQQVKWLLLDEPAMTALVGPPMYALPHDIRSYAAAVASRTLPVQAVNWKAFRDQPAGRVRLYNGRGIEGVWRSPKPIKRGDKISLFPDGVALRGRFPALTLNQSAPSAVALPNFHIATVSAWVNPTRMKVALSSGGTATLEVASGAALTGDQVLVHHDPTVADSPKTYVGALTKWANPTGWTGDRTATVTITGAGPAARTFHAESAAGERVVVRANWLRHASTGSRLVVALIGAHAATGLPEAMPLTCCVP